jgi:lysozyme
MILRFFKIVLLFIALTFPVQVGSADRDEERIIMPDTLNKDKLREQLVRHEGMKQSAYQDSLGYWTIGVGHLIDERKGGKLSIDSIYAILDEDIQEKCDQLDEHLSWWRNLDEARQRVLLDMCFNLGINGLLSFHNTLAFIEHGQYKEAAANMLDSKWAKQVGNRAIFLSQVMEYGV